MTDQGSSGVSYEAPEAAAAALRSLPAADLVRLERIARSRSYGLAPLEWSDLLHEAVSRVIGGSRRWPSGVSLIVFMAQTMRSIANEHRRQLYEGPFVTAHSLGDVSGLPTIIPGDEPSADRIVSARQTLDEIYLLFRGDRNVTALISGIEQGETAVETMRRAGLTAQEYDAARKRFRRGVDRLLLGNEAPK